MTRTVTQNEPAIRTDMLNIRKDRRLKKQGGFTLTELIVVMVVVGILALLMWPIIKPIIISARTTPTANDINSAVMRIRANAEGTGNTPYAAMSTAALANTLLERTNALTVTGVGAAATLQHRLGTSGAQVTAVPATITTAGDSFNVNFPTVNKGACPDLGSLLQNNSEIITINGTTIKSVPAGIVWNGQTASNACTAGDTNTFVFTLR